MYFGSALFRWYNADLCFFDKLPALITQFDPEMFAFWHKKEKKTDNNHIQTQLAFVCSKLTIETLEQGEKYVQS